MLCLSAAHSQGGTCLLPGLAVADVPFSVSHLLTLSVAVVLFIVCPFYMMLAGSSSSDATAKSIAEPVNLLGAFLTSASISMQDIKGKDSDRALLYQHAIGNTVLVAGA